jgi:tetratricopeptide (TPR) repeat protein
MRAPLHISRTLLTLLLAVLALVAAAQSAEQFITWGDRAMAAGEHYGASRYYGEALKQTPGTMELQWNYAEACRLSNQYAEAADYYDKVQRKDHARKHPEALRWLAEMQMSTGHYDDAEATWAKVKQKERKKDSFIAQRADNGLAGCRLAKALLADPDTVVRIEHLPMPVNSFDSEFGARTGPDSALYFTSLRGEVNADGEVQDTASYHARIFRTRESSGTWAEPAPLPANVNNARNNANSSWSSDGRWFYFSREDAPGRFSIHALDLHNPGDTGTVVLRVPGSTVTQPMVANHQGGEVLFFVSNRPGGQGGLDIWWGHITGTVLSDAKPLGAPVNTPGNETGPFLDARDNTLYFSSDFLPGMGGYDLFKSELDNGAPGLPINMGVPFNSPANDLYPAVYGNPASGWLTSNRAGSFAEKGETCCNDLYRFSYPGSEATVPPPAPDTATTAAVQEIREKRITSLREKLPIRLYFHNDEPDPRSWDTTTTLDYAETYRSYRAKKPEYDAAWQGSAEGSKAFDVFFAQQVEQGFAQLDQFIALLKEALDEGQRITLQVRGYASPLAKSDYNKNLSLRRIATLVHYLERTDHGALLPYLNGTAPNGGQLVVVPQPFGKSTADASVSDRLDDLQHSVYGVGAAMERRIEIEQVVGR